MKIFQMSDLSVQIGDRTFCKGISLSIAPGEKLAILGPNGAGKTTLLSVLAGIKKPKQGKVYYDNRAVHYQDRRLSVGSQFTSYPLFLRVSELLKIFELSSNNIHQQKLTELRSFLQPCLKSYYHELSGGECKLVSDYLAMALGSECLLLDEPTSSLDVAASELVNSIMKKDLRTLIFSSHDLREALKITQRILFLTGRQAYHFDLRQGQEFGLFRRAGKMLTPVEEPYQSCQIGNMSYLIAALPCPSPPQSWQHQGEFSAILLLYQLFNLIRNAEEERV